jgi:hypothetical protein
MRIGRGISQSFRIALLLLACCTLSAKNEAPRVRNILSFKKAGNL